jgi:hypothetical protein
MYGTVEVWSERQGTKKNNGTEQASVTKDKLGEEALAKISRVEFSPVAVHNCT